MKKSITLFLTIIVMSCLVFAYGCQSKNDTTYQSLSEIFQVIDEDPTEIVNSDSEQSKYVSFTGTISKLDKEDMTFVLSDDEYTLDCYFTDETIATDFFGKYKDNDVVNVTGLITENDSSYQAEISEVK